MLKAGYIENDLYHLSELGTPQGGLISPVLANIYLNNFDWTVGRMYQTPRQRCKNIKYDRERLKHNGAVPKYLVRYADDWVMLTTTKKEARKLLKYLKKYFKHKLKLELSDEKTIITDLTQNHIKFLCFLIKAEAKRKTPNEPTSNKLVGKSYPNPEKVRKQIKQICKEIQKLKEMPKDVDKAIQIERINTMIIGIAEYWKSGICSNTYQYIDDKIHRCTYKVFQKLYPETYMEHFIELNKLTNRPQGHAKYQTKTFAIRVNDMYIGMTKAFITHSHL